VLLDLGLPDGDGIDVTRQLRAWTQVPIIVVSARGMEVDKIAAFEAGADDYMIKPFGVPELLARMRVALRHAARAAPRTRRCWCSASCASTSRGARCIATRRRCI
jgi:two-component system KDP operon response regulator KdpE